MPGGLEVSLLEDPDTDVMHGLGETALPPVAPAIGNAVADAIGVGLQQQPMTAERVLAAWEGRT
jgi:CO/xanthine dehydrogenase Mo-binding subunit